MMRNRFVVQPNKFKLSPVEIYKPGIGFRKISCCVNPKQNITLPPPNYSILFGGSPLSGGPLIKNGGIPSSNGAKIYQGGNP